MSTRHIGALLIATGLAAGTVALAGCGGSESPRVRATRTLAGRRPHGHRATLTELAQRRRSRRNRGDARAVARVLRYTRYIDHGSRHRREVALTFDDGPSTYTAAILRELRRAHVRATFFVIGYAVRSLPHGVAAELRGGNVVADHTMNHPFIGALTLRAQRAEIRGNVRLLERRAAGPVRLFRPPYASFDDRTLKVLRRMRMLMVLWSVDSEDYTRPGVKKIAANVVGSVKPGGIVLMHDGGGPREQTVRALPRIIRSLRRRHYRFVTVPQLLRDAPPSRHQPRRPRLGVG